MSFDRLPLFFASLLLLNGVACFLFAILMCKLQMFVEITLLAEQRFAAVYLTLVGLLLSVNSQMLVEVMPLVHHLGAISMTAKESN